MIMTSQLELWTCPQAVVLFLQYAFIFTIFVSYFVVDCFRSCAANFVFQCTITINAFYSVLTYLYVYGGDGGDGVSMSQCFIQPPDQGLALVTSWYRLFHCETNSIIREELRITVSAKLPQKRGMMILFPIVLFLVLILDAFFYILGRIAIRTMRLNRWHVFRNLGSQRKLRNMLDLHYTLILLSTKSNSK